MDVFEQLKTEHNQAQELLGRLERGELGPDAPEVAEVVRDLSVHAASEELTLYPLVEKTVPGGELMVEQSLKEHQLVKDLLAEIERSSGVDRVPLLASLTAYVRHHVHHEEEKMFPKLRDHASDAQIEELGREFEQAERIAPTHPHPHAPRKPPANAVAGLLAGVLDKARDALKSRG